MDIDQAARANALLHYPHINPAPTPLHRMDIDQAARANAQDYFITPTLTPPPPLSTEWTSTRQLELTRRITSLPHINPPTPTPPLHRMDIDQAARANAQDYFGVKDPDYYEMQAHIIIDDGMEFSHQGAAPAAEEVEGATAGRRRRSCNVYVKQLVSAMQDAAWFVL